MVRVVGEGDIETSSAPVEAKLKLRLSLATVGKPTGFAQVELRLTVFFIRLWIINISLCPLVDLLCVIFKTLKNFENTFRECLARS